LDVVRRDVFLKHIVSETVSRKGSRWWAMSVYYHVYCNMSSSKHLCLL